MYGNALSNTLSIRIGSFCFLENDSVLLPGVHKDSGDRMPMTLGDWVAIGHQSHVEASSIGSYVLIQEGCKIVRNYFKLKEFLVFYIFILFREMAS